MYYLWAGRRFLRRAKRRGEETPAGNTLPPKFWGRRGGPIGMPFWHGQERSGYNMQKESRRYPFRLDLRLITGVFNVYIVVFIKLS